MKRRAAPVLLATFASAALMACQPSGAPPGRPGAVPTAGVPPTDILAGVRERTSEDAGAGRGLVVPGTGLTGSFPVAAASGAVVRAPAESGTGLHARRAMGNR